MMVGCCEPPTASPGPDRYQGNSRLPWRLTINEIPGENELGLGHPPEELPKVERLNEPYGVGPSMGEAEPTAVTLEPDFP